MTTAHDTQRRISAHFDDFAPTYHRTAFDGEGMAELSRRDLEVIERACDLTRPGGAACDRGVGSGRISSRLVERGFGVVGVDASSGMLRQARARLGDAVPLVQASLSAPLPLPSASFDLVTCLRVLKYLPCWSASVAELARIAAPGGIVCFDLANRRSAARFGYPAGMVWPATWAEAAAALEAAGLRVEAVVPGAHVPDPLWRAAKAPLPARAVTAVDRVAEGVAGRVAARSWTFVARRAEEPSEGS